MEKEIDANFWVVFVVAVVAIVSMIIFGINTNTEVSDLSGEATKFLQGTYELKVGESVVVGGRTITLEDVGRSKVITVDVDGIGDMIPSRKIRTVNEVEIYNRLAVYSNKEDQKSAQISVLFREGESCSDNDGGKNYYLRGEIKGYDTYGNYQRTDTCAQTLGGIYKDNKYKDLLIEYYCNAGKIASVEIICPNGCKDGVCLKP
ncbi:MAG: hypothetical protein PHG05_01055 [Candidatus Nanoarchaeia archaeon]|nr:hypothetical protein [Candidatus Nanoarchaeia archaeon]